MQKEVIPSTGNFELISYPFIIASTSILGGIMARRVFFSFHYERDIWRANQIRNSWVTKEDREAAGFWDAATREKIRREGDPVIKRWIDNNLKGTSVTAVLIGTETSKRKWVRYEIEKSLEKGNDIIGVRIHNLKDQNGERDWAGDLDFGLIDGENTFSELFPIYDWVDDDGYENFGYWIERSEPVARSDFGILDTIVTLVIGGLAIGALSSLFKPRCPWCNAKIDKGILICSNCGTYLK